MNANESNRRNDFDSDDELATVYERPTSEQAKDRLNNADSATIDGWDVTLDDEDELKNDDQNESESDSLALDEDELERAKEDVAYVDALLNGEDPEDDESDDEYDVGEMNLHEIAHTDTPNKVKLEYILDEIQEDDEDVATDGGVDMRQPEDESHDVERGDEIIVDDVADSRQPMTVRVIYHDGAIKAIDQFDGRYQVSAGDVGNRVDVVDDADKRTDYVDLGGIDKLQLDEDDIEPVIAPNDQPTESDRFSDGRIDIEDRGEWNWALCVMPEGVVRASKAIPYDGTVAYSTADQHSKPRGRSQHRLDIDQVVARYHDHSETEMAEQELRIRIQEALSRNSVRIAHSTDCGGGDD